MRSSGCFSYFKTYKITHHKKECLMWNPILNKWVSSSCFPHFVTYKITKVKRHVWCGINLQVLNEFQVDVSLISQYTKITYVVTRNVWCEIQSGCFLNFLTYKITYTIDRKNESDIRLLIIGNSSRMFWLSHDIQNSLCVRYLEVEPNSM